jgi:hypothetical protein
MRLIFFSLLLIVVGYFAWNQWGVPWYISIDSQPIEAVSTGAINSLVLLSERPVPLAVSDAKENAVPTPINQQAQIELRGIRSPESLIKPVVTPLSRTDSVLMLESDKPEGREDPSVLICWEFGPFDDKSEADRFNDVIGGGGQVVERIVKQISAKWLVLMSSSDGLVAPTKELSTFLEQQGLFMSRTGVQGEVAIGPFVSEKVALSYQARLLEIGAMTNLRSVDEGEKEFWLRSEFQSEQLSAVNAAFNRYLSRSQDKDITQLVCN